MKAFIFLALGIVTGWQYHVAWVSYNEWRKLRRVQKTLQDDLFVGKTRLTAESKEYFN